MADIGIEIEIVESDPRFFEALEDPEGFMPALAGAMSNIMDAYKDQASQYAPESEANHPGRFSLRTHKPMGFYERGRGWWYPLMTHNTMGLGGEQAVLTHSIKAPKTIAVKHVMAVGIAGVAGYRLNPTSEQMGDRWVSEVEQRASEVLGHLSNSASYSSFVQGWDQTALHKARDWQTVLMVWVSPEMQAVVEDETMAAISQYYNL